ncbi:MAG TPA: maleylpyruvate isomerase N-terminal domain-containing protein [Streptosporangiaceae bacterium]|nr:maleylpyruvate isomerase N-terminal domain-containing protein [Streptosporangiaceae bacterium]
MTVFDDLAAEQDRLDHILSGLDEAQWTSPSDAAGWTIADVVLHLAQSEESVVVTMSGRGLRTSLGAMAGGTVEERVAEMVRTERAAPEAVFGRWRRARQSALSALRAADPDRPVEWVTGPVKPATLATTRAGRALGARPGHYRAARHRLAGHRPAAPCGLAGAPHAALRDDAGRGAAG